MTNLPSRFRKLYEAVYGQLAEAELPSQERELARYGPQWQDIGNLFDQLEAMNVSTAIELDDLKPYSRARSRFFAAYAAHRSKATRVATNARKDAHAIAGAATARLGLTSEMEQTVIDTAATAAMALAVRDLIGKYHFSQDHYDDLTVCWRNAVGSIHPADR